MVGAFFGSPQFASATTVGPILQLQTPNAPQRAPSISWDGTRYVIVWEDGRNAQTGVDLYVARVMPDGTLMDSDGIALLQNDALPGDQTQPTIVYNPGSAVHYLAWTAPGPSGLDIFATRFLPDTGSVVPSGGTLVTSYPAQEMNTDADGSPTIACTVQTCLIAFQSVLTGGGGRSRIRGRRLFPDGVNFFDARPLDLVDNSSGAFFEAGASVISIGSTFFLGWEDDRNTNLDPFVRTISDLSPLTADIGAAMANDPLGQTDVSVSPLGAGNWIAVWEDGQLASDDNIVGRRYNVVPSALGPSFPISTAAMNQRRPIVSGDDNGALVVWQDRRTGGPNGITYGARLDSSGNVRDPDGFPVLFYDMNSFEHTVVKGPGSDYLVASVRFDPGIPRIFYRIVRDEEPDGVMTPMGPMSVPADGVTTADISFGPAQGPSGLPVVDGTLYTVVVDNPNVTVTPADVAPGIMGHQVGSAMGQVGISMQTTDHSMVSVSINSVDGAAVGSATVIFENVPPVAADVVIGPMAPRSTVDLSLAYTYSDVNMDTESGTLIQWSKNSAIQGNLNGLTVPAAETSRGEIWRARVTPNDGMDPGTAVFSNEIQVGNARPAALTPRIDPGEDIRTGTPIRARYIFDDPDRDGEGPTELRWFDRGVEQTMLMNTEDLPGERIQKGQVWRFTVLPHDGIETGDLVSSSTVTVINTKPIADAGARGMVLERRDYTLDGSASSDIDPQDGLTFQWTQVDGPEVELSSSSTATPSFTAPSVRGSQILRFELVVSDGEEDSDPVIVLVDITPIEDTDNDGLDNEEEALVGTNPEVTDTDRDGLTDLQEVEASTNPLDQDSDDDGVRDGSEGQMCRNCDPDPLGDIDGNSVINALDPDTDGDGVFDGTELGIRDPIAAGGMAPFEYLGTDESAGFYIADADPTTTTDPLVADTDMDTFPDGTEDANGNGRIDEGESDPNDPTDPGISCSGETCPANFYCGPDGICLPGAGPDAGMMCMPLQETLECCMSGCTGGTKVDPVCSTPGSREQCPIGADQCRVGSCSDEPMPTDDGGGSCGCTKMVSDGSAMRALSQLWGVLMLGAFGLIRRRR